MAQSVAFWQQNFTPCCATRLSSRQSFGSWRKFSNLSSVWGSASFTRHHILEDTLRDQNWIKSLCPCKTSHHLFFSSGAWSPASTCSAFYNQRLEERRCGNSFQPNWSSEVLSNFLLRNFKNPFKRLFQVGNGWESYRLQNPVYFYFVLYQLIWNDCWVFSFL